MRFERIANVAVAWLAVALVGGDVWVRARAQEVPPTAGWVQSTMPGPPGPQGDPGLSAYQVWLAAGNSGTVTDYLNSLKGATGNTGATGPAGSANNVQFTGSVNLNFLVAIGKFSSDITVSGVLSTDPLNCMPNVDLPSGIVFSNCRPIANNSVRMYFQALSILTPNVTPTFAITALR